MAHPRFKHCKGSQKGQGRYYASVIFMVFAASLGFVPQVSAETLDGVTQQTVLEDQTIEKGKPLEAPIQSNSSDNEQGNSLEDIVRPVDIRQNPRFLSLRSASVNMRSGPGTRYPIVWEYRRRGMPVKVVAEFENWRKIQDVTGEEGWVHVSLLSRARGILVTGHVRTLYAKPDVNGEAIAKVEPSVVGSLDSCENNWCRVTIGSFKGWMQADALWGL